MRIRDLRLDAKDENDNPIIEVEYNDSSNEFCHEQITLSQLKGGGGGGSYAPGDGIDITNDTISVKLDDDSGLDISDGKLKIDNESSEIINEASEHMASTEIHVTTEEKDTWNGKQDALSTQTAYSGVGSSTKVAKITTNELGQVTNITEVDIQGVANAEVTSNRVSTITSSTSGTKYPSVAGLRSYTDQLAIYEANINTSIKTVTLLNGKTIKDLYDAFSAGKDVHIRATLTLNCWDFRMQWMNINSSNKIYFVAISEHELDVTNKKQIKYIMQEDGISADASALSYYKIECAVTIV